MKEAKISKKIECRAGNKNLGCRNKELLDLDTPNCPKPLQFIKATPVKIEIKTARLDIWMGQLNKFRPWVLV